MMTNREIRRKASALLGRDLWRIFAVTSLYLLLTFAVTDYIFPIGLVRAEETPMLYSAAEIAQMRRTLMIAVVVAFVAQTALQNLYSLFAAGALRVGKSRFLMEDRIENTKIARLFDGFRTEYWNVSKAMYSVTWRVELASLLILPGILLRLKWSLVPYILAENPRLSGSEARALSERMTQGHLRRIARMWLGFVWMYILLIPTCGAGLYFLYPYQESVGVELYAALREEALQTGSITAQELPGVELTL